MNAILHLKDEDNILSGHTKDIQVAYTVHDSLKFFKGFVVVESEDAVDQTVRCLVQLHDYEFRFNRLEEDGRQHVWRTLTSPWDFTSEDYEKLAAFVMDGHQINNAMRLANLWAKGSQQSLNVEHCIRFCYRVTNVTSP